ncbi:MAG: conjugal transfer protein TraN [Rhodocyclaceae bacterium]|nr:conjugal transfer protein TraN [Rhodocyclaceae bacterium]
MLGAGNLLNNMANGGFTFWGLEFSITSSGVGFVGFDPWSLAFSVAMHFIMQMFQCDEEEKLLAMRRGQNLCHKVGSWCDKKILGACVRKKESYCCFVSKLARIVNQQGRPQVGRGWGDRKHPDCRGFTLEELGMLKLDQMNFAEFVRDIVPDPKSANFAVDRLNAKAQSYYGGP